MYTQVAAATAVGLLLMSGAIFFARPRDGIAGDLTTAGSGSVVARRFLPAAFLIPVFLGWIVWQGQLAGMYGNELGVALYATRNILGVCDSGVVERAKNECGAWPAQQGRERNPGIECGSGNTGRRADGCAGAAGGGADRTSSVAGPGARRHHRVRHGEPHFILEPRGRDQVRLAVGLSDGGGGDRFAENGIREAEGGNRSRASSAGQLGERNKPTNTRRNAPERGQPLGDATGCRGKGGANSDDQQRHHRAQGGAGCVVRGEGTRRGYAQLDRGRRAVHGHFRKHHVSESRRGADERLAVERSGGQAHDRSPKVARCRKSGNYPES